MLSRQPSKEGHAGQFGKQDVRFGVEVEGHENPGAFAGDRGDAMQGVPPPEEDERPVAHPQSVGKDRVVQQRTAVRLLYAFHFFDDVSEPLHVEPIDLQQLLEVLFLVVRHFVVAHRLFEKRLVHEGRVPVFGTDHRTRGRLKI